MGTYNIIELAHKVKVKHLMIASSSSVYGANKKTPYSENDSVKLQMSIYASTKLATESIAHHTPIYGRHQQQYLDFLQYMVRGADQIWLFLNLLNQF